MKKPTSNSILCLLGVVNGLSLASAAVLYFHSTITSQGAIAARAKSLNTIAQHVKSRTCWITASKEPFKLGDVVTTGGSDTGRLPTGCIYASYPEQFLNVAYEGGVLKVVQIYSRQEVRNQLSIISKDKNHGANI